MASVGADVSAETYERFSETYLMLWRQLEIVAGENKWLEIGSEGLSAIQEDIRRRFESLSPDPSSALSSDYQRVQQLLLSGPRANATEAAAFRDYLRDSGLRYAQLADGLLAEAEKQNARKAAKSMRQSGA